jgi:hypothetical protein
MYHIFAGEQYYPCGGVSDHQGSKDTLEEAMEFVANLKCDWWHIADSELNIVKSGRCRDLD